MRRIRPGMTEFELERYAGKNKELKQKSLKSINSQFDFFKMEAARPSGQCVLQFTGPALATCLIFLPMAPADSTSSSL